MKNSVLLKCSILLFSLLFSGCKKDSFQNSNQLELNNNPEYVSKFSTSQVVFQCIGSCSSSGESCTTKINYDLTTGSKIFFCSCEGCSLRITVDSNVFSSKSEMDSELGEGQWDRYLQYGKYTEVFENYVADSLGTGYEEITKVYLWENGNGDVSLKFVYVESASGLTKSIGIQNTSEAMRNGDPTIVVDCKGDCGCVEEATLNPNGSVTFACSCDPCKMDINFGVPQSQVE